MRKSIPIAVAACLAASGLHAAPAPQPGNVSVTQGNCNVTVINTGSGSQTVKVEAAVCADQVDPAKAIRIRYVWLNAVSASLLLAGKVDGDLAHALGANPYLTKNKVYDELAEIVRRFGSTVAPRRTDGAQASMVSTTLQGLEDTSDEPTPLMYKQFRKLVGTPKIYNAEESTVLPDVDAYLAIQNTPTFPSNYSMYYYGEVAPDARPQDVIGITNLWRELTADDLASYAQNTAKLRALVLQRKFGFDLDPAYNAKNIKFADELSNRTVAAMQYFARAGWPPHYLIGSANLSYCGDSPAATIDMAPRTLYLQVAVLDNVMGRGALPIARLHGEQIVSDRLRLDDDDHDWAPIDLAFPAGVLQANKSIVVPLQLQLRAGDMGRIEGQPEDQPKIFKQVQSYPAPLVMKDEKGKVVYRKQKDAFKSPTLPVKVDYTYGPRLRLLSVVSDDKEIKLRPFNPLVVAMHFGFEEGSCPSIYVQAPDAKVAVSYGRILVGAAGHDRARTDVLWHDGPAQFVELAEDEPEITRVRSLKVYVVDAQGSEHLAADRTDVFVMPGLPLRLSSPELLSATRIRIEVEGYYKTLPSLLLENASLDDMKQ